MARGILFVMLGYRFGTSVSWRHFVVDSDLQLRWCLFVTHPLSTRGRQITTPSKSPKQDLRKITMITDKTTLRQLSIFPCLSGTLARIVRKDLEDDLEGSHSNHQAIRYFLDILDNKYSRIYSPCIVMLAMRHHYIQHYPWENTYNWIYDHRYSGRSLLGQLLEAGEPWEKKYSRLYDEMTELNALKGVHAVQWDNPKIESPRSSNKLLKIMEKEDQIRQSFEEALAYVIEYRKISNALISSISAKDYAHLSGKQIEQIHMEIIANM